MVYSDWEDVTTCAYTLTLAMGTMPVRRMPVSPSSASCFGPMLSGSLLAYLLHTTLGYRLPILCVGVLSYYSHPSSQRPVSLLSFHQIYEIQADDALRASSA